MKPRIALVLVVVEILVVFTLAMWSAKIRCDSAVSVRDDQRAVWLYLVDERNDPTNPEVVSFVEFLNDRLPALACSWGVTPKPTG